MMTRLFIALFSSFLCLFSCVPKKEKTLLINGAGASFPYILYSKWIMEYKKNQASVRINYQSIGSGGGIRQFMAGTLDFGGTDIPLFQEEQGLVARSESHKASFKTKKVSSTKKEDFKKPILHIPTALGAVAITYNLPSLEKKELKLTGELLAKIFRGEIEKWNDPQIQKLNRALKLPDKKITLIYRADGSGTTSFFTEFLALKSPEFLKEIGRGKSVSWPRGLGAKGNEGVMGLLNKMEGSLSYVGLSYALSQKLPVAAIKNKAGFFVQPNSSSLQEAALAAIKNNQAYTSSLIDIKGDKSYPLSGYTYFIVSQIEEPKQSALFDFIEWTLKEGQKFSRDLHFIPLPSAIQEKALQNLSQLKKSKV